MKKYVLWSLPLIVIVVLITIYAMTSTAVAPTTDTNTTVGTDSVTMEDTQKLVGTWKNSTEADSVVEFKADGTMIDVTDKVTTPGTWEIFNSEMPLPENVPYEFTPGNAYLTVKIERGSRYFLISSITETDLEIVSMDGNIVLTFVRQ